jgi:hypothetical protein
MIITTHKQDYRYSIIAIVSNLLFLFWYHSATPIVYALNGFFLLLGALYILKGDAFDNLETEKEKDFYLKNNILFWLTGVKKFNISRKLSKLLNTFDDVINEKRFYFFNSDDDLKSFLNKEYENVSKTVFDRGFISADDAGRLCDEYIYTASGLYSSLSLPSCPFLDNLRFKDFFIFGKNILNVGDTNGI